MTIQDLKKQKIAILGFGHEGQAVFSYLKKHGVEADVLDEKDGENYLDNLSEYTVIFRSPGVPRLTPKLMIAEKAGAIVTSQTKWFFEHCPAKIVGITGTKGKGTTSSLIFDTLVAEGEKAFLTGNIGKTAPLDFVDDLTAEDIVVFEMSSFQLQDLTTSPHIGICLMVTSDHLNHHKDLTEYHIAKSAITGFQNENDIAIYNIDYPASKTIGELGKGRKISISAQKKPVNGAFIEGDTIFVYKEQDQFEKVFDCTNRNLRGAHNLENIAASILACIELGIPEETISRVCNDFKGLEHRLQLVGEVNGVRYYNDSISTVPETALAAINSFVEPIHLILGGSNKGLNYEPMIDEIMTKSNIASITMLGEVGQKLKALFDIRREQIDWRVPVSYSYDNFSQAIADIKSIAKEGDVVLLSPAAASFDMFNGYIDRGNQFVKFVLANDNV